MANITTRAAIALIFGALIVAAPAKAAVPGFPDAAIKFAADDLSNVVKAQAMFWGGRRYCWYFDGWRGPGWYQCGYRFRRGFGWGGGAGWHGWHHPGLRPGVRPGRPGVGRPGRPDVRPGGRPRPPGGGGGRPNRPGGRPSGR
jgi:hypothetical protein